MVALALFGLWFSIGNDHSPVRTLQVSAAHEHPGHPAAGPEVAVATAAWQVSGGQCPDDVHKSDHHLAHSAFGSPCVPSPRLLLALTWVPVMWSAITRAVTPSAAGTDSSRRPCWSGRLALSQVCVSRT